MTKNSSPDSPCLTNSVPLSTRRSSTRVAKRDSSLVLHPEKNDTLESSSVISFFVAFAMTRLSPFVRSGWHASGVGLGRSLRTTWRRLEEADRSAADRGGNAAGGFLLLLLPIRRYVVLLSVIVLVVVLVAKLFT